MKQPETLTRSAFTAAGSDALLAARRWRSSPASPRLAALADLIGETGGSEAERAERFVTRVRELMEKVGIPSCLPSLREEDIPGIAKQALAEAFFNYPVPRYMGQAQCEQLLHEMLG